VIEGFKKFILKGNAIDLAVGVVIGAAFGAIVTSFTTNLIQPIINEVLGGGVEGGTIELSPGNVMNFGAVLNAIITFLITAAVVYFVFVLPMNKLQERRDRQLDEPTELSNEEKMVQLLEQIAAK
jgi:large conductance mechanosensitive channel